MPEGVRAPSPLPDALATRSRPWAGLGTSTRSRPWAPGRPRVQRRDGGRAPEPVQAPHAGRELAELRRGAPYGGRNSPRDCSHVPSYSGGQLRWLLLFLMQELDAWGVSWQAGRQV